MAMYCGGPYLCAGTHTGSNGPGRRCLGLDRAGGRHGESSKQQQLAQGGVHQRERRQTAGTQTPDGLGVLLRAQVGMRHFHLNKNHYYNPIINLDKLWSLVGEEVSSGADVASEHAH